MKNIVQYQRGLECCFLCKEKLRIEHDRSIQQNLNQDQVTLGLNGCPVNDENSYFVDAKRIRVTVKTEDGKTEKKEVVVHMDCFKQLEKLK